MIFGFKQDKSKAEVYDKSEVYKKTELNDLLAVQKISYSIGSIEGLAIAQKTIPITSITGYTPVGVIGYKIVSNTILLYADQIEKSEYSNYVDVRIINRSEITVSDVSITVNVLYVKDNFI